MYNICRLNQHRNGALPLIFDVARAVKWLTGGQGLLLASAVIEHNTLDVATSSC